MYFTSGVMVGLFLSLGVCKYRGPPVRWEFEEVE
jgi:hypothetical protein